MPFGPTKQETTGHSKYTFSNSLYNFEISIDVVIHISLHVIPRTNPLPSAFLCAGVGCLKLRVAVPQYKLRGELAVLECHYELEGDTLYSVKWYKENEEFYRFVPKSNPPQQSYKVEGIKVDHQLSDSRQVALRGVNLKSSGIYRCEVSAEAPSFESAQSEGRMEVVCKYFFKLISIKLNLILCLVY
ncbi:hypothetical protein AAG570_000554 [Ranatra chinensis]|uniref:Ig-like domain-containing protein n=1 Tax=Ranatra chinensis TaxID=642074 RepID=A0ABD0ZKQ2_9HEMI